MMPCELWLDACVLHQRTTFNPRRHPTCWASSQWSHTVSGMPCHGAWTPAPLNSHPSIDIRCTAPQIETPICTRRTITHQSIWQHQHTCWAMGRSPVESGVVGQPHKTLRFHSRHRHQPTHPEWPSQEKPGSGLSASAPVSGVFAPARTSGVWPSLRRVSVAQKNKPTTMLFSNVQSSDLLMDCTVWLFWALKQPNGCSTPAPKASVAKQWIKELVQKKKRSKIIKT